MSEEALMRTPSKTQKNLLTVAFIATLVALYINNTQYNYAISVTLILLVLLVSISGVMTYRSESSHEESSGFNSGLAVTILILLCAGVSIYLIKVSSEPIFSEASFIESTVVLAELTRH